MTPPDLTAVPPTVHRRRTPPSRHQARQDFVRRVERALARREPVFVRVDGYGWGWLVLGVDRVRERFTVLRGSGDPIDVSWRSVPLDQ